MKKLFQVGILLGLIIGIALSGCGGSKSKKPTPPDPNNPNPKKSIIYAAGYFYEEGMEKPFYWTSKDAERISPSDGGAITSIAYGNGQIYYGGDDSFDRPCFWVENIQTLLGTDGEVTSMVYVNGNLYCGGNYYDGGGDLHACYWIGANNIPNALAEDNGRLYTIVLGNGAVYSGGYHCTGNLPCYWKGNNSPVTLSTQEGHVLSSSFADGKVYLGGFYGTTPCYWTVDSADQDRVETYDLSSDNGQVRAIIYANGTVYCGGYYLDDSSNRIPCYWTGASKDPILLPIPEGMTGGMVESITYANGTVYCGGNYSNNSNEYPCYWVKGASNPVSLFPDGVNGGSVKAILVE